MTTAQSPALDVVRSSLLEWFASASDLPLAAIAWADEPQRVIQGASGSIRVLSDVAIGRAESQHEYNPAAANGAQIQQAVGGQRILTLQLTIDGIDQRAPQHPMFRMARAETRMSGPGSIAALRALGFALIETTGAVNNPRRDSGRTYPRATLDVRIGYTRVEFDAATTWIESAVITSRLADESGTEAPAPPNETYEVTP